MVSTKRYKYRIDDRGVCAIKEDIKRINKENEYRRITISVGISDKLEIKGRSVFKKGILEEEEERTEGVYYLLDEIAYLVTLRYEIQEDGTEDVRITMIHVPNGILADDEITSKLVTQDFSEEVKEQIIENVIGYIREQL